MKKRSRRLKKKPLQKSRKISWNYGYACAQPIDVNNGSGDFIITIKEGYRPTKMEWEKIRRTIPMIKDLHICYKPPLREEILKGAMKALYDVAEQKLLSDPRIKRDPGEIKKRTSEIYEIIAEKFNTTHQRVKNLLWSKS